MSWEVKTGHTLDELAKLKPKSFQACITSPPYWGLRDYGDKGQQWPAVSYAPMSGLSALEIPEQLAALGLEPDSAAYVGHLVEVFRAVRRVLRDDGTLWLNLGDSFANKQLQGIPWRVAYALQADGWYLRSDIIWHKPNPMPESITDRPTKAHEYLFLLTKSARYFYDAGAIAEPAGSAGKKISLGEKSLSIGQASGANVKKVGNALKDSYLVKDTRNKRSVWTIPTRPYSGAHFAVMPPGLVEPCIRAGSKPGDLILDPFSGAGTTGLIANRLRRDYIGTEQSEKYAEISRRRIEGDSPLFNRQELTNDSR